MSLKLSLILLCGLFAHAIHAQQFAISQIVDQVTTDGAPKDFIYAAKATGRVLESLAQAHINGEEKNAIVPLWNAVIRTWNHEKGSETFKLIVSKIREIMQDHTAHQTIVSIATMLHNCFTYEVKEKSLRFPWKEFRKLLYSDGIHAFPKMYTGMWNIALNAKTKDKFSILVDTLGDTFVEIEKKEDLKDILNDKDIENRMNKIIQQQNSSGAVPGEPQMGARDIDNEDSNLEEREVIENKSKEHAPGYLFSNGGIDTQSISV